MLSSGRLPRALGTLVTTESWHFLLMLEKQRSWKLTDVSIKIKLLTLELTGMSCSDFTWCYYSFTLRPKSWPHRLQFDGRCHHHRRRAIFARNIPHISDSSLKPGSFKFSWRRTPETRCQASSEILIPRQLPTHTTWRRCPGVQTTAHPWWRCSSSVVAFHLNDQMPHLNRDIRQRETMIARC